MKTENLEKLINDINNNDNVSLMILAQNIEHSDISYLNYNNIIFSYENILFLLSKMKNMSLLNNTFFEYLKKINIDKNFAINYLIDNNINVYNMYNLKYIIDYSLFKNSNYNLDKFYKIIEFYFKNENVFNIYNIINFMTFNEFIKFIDEYNINNIDILNAIYNDDKIFNLNINDILKLLHKCNNKIFTNNYFLLKLFDKKYKEILNNKVKDNEIVIRYFYMGININEFIWKYTKSNPANLIIFLKFFRILFDEKMELKFLKKLKNKLYFKKQIVEHILNYYNFKYENNKKYVNGLLSVLILQNED